MVNFHKMSSDEFKKAVLSILERMAEAADHHDIFIPDLTVEVGKVKVSLTLNRSESLKEENK